MIVAAGLFAYRFYRKAMATLETVERVHIAPLHARVDVMLDEVQRIADKVKHAQDSVSGVADAVKARTWPLIGIVNGLRTAAAVVRKNGRKDHDSAYGPL
jgi:hypothetical protein